MGSGRSSLPNCPELSFDVFPAVVNIPSSCPVCLAGTVFALCCSLLVMPSLSSSGWWYESNLKYCSVCVGPSLVNFMFLSRKLTWTVNCGTSRDSWYPHPKAKNPTVSTTESTFRDFHSFTIKPPLRHSHLYQWVRSMREGGIEGGHDDK